MIILKNISKRYPEGSGFRSVLEDITADIPETAFSVLLGPSGSGKSTLLNIISGIDLPTSGEIIINGQNLTNMNEKRRTLFRRTQIGIVFQFFNLLPTLSVIDNVILPMELNGTKSKHAKSLAQDLLDTVGLLDRQNTFPDRLSGGEQQRVAIARALASDPPIILADEPTGNLDSGNANQIMTLLSDLHIKFKKTLVVVTHRNDFIKLADKIFIVEDGQISERGDIS
jgi:putative ABC transport system ATP-binding protein